MYRGRLSDVKRTIIDKMLALGIVHYILIGENILTFHSGDDDYYQEWVEEVSEEGGWVALLNLLNMFTTTSKMRASITCFLWVPITILLTGEYSNHPIFSNYWRNELKVP